MAYEKAKLVVAGMSGKIYLAGLNKDGTMSDSRKDVTDECLRVTTEWFMKNNQKGFRFESVLPDKDPHIFFTDNTEKAKRIIAILKEEI